MVNSRNVHELADFIEREERLPFNMNDGHRPAPPDAKHACGTAGCIGGFSAALWPSVYEDVGASCNYQFNETLLGIKLGIGQKQLDALCFPGDHDVYFAEEEWGEVRSSLIAYRELTRKGAVKTLRRLAATGEVQWLKCEQL